MAARPKAEHRAAGRRLTSPANCGESPTMPQPYYLRRSGRNWISALAVLALGRALPADTPAPATPPPAPQRIIATAPNNTEILCALGLTDRLVGVSTFVTHPPAVQKLPRVGGIDDPDLEAILALRPDLVVLRGGNPHLEQLCERNRIRLYQDKTDSLESIFVTIRELGAITGRSNEAEKLAGDLRGQLDAVKVAAAGRARPRVAMTIRSPDKLVPMTTVGKPSFLNNIIQLAGGENVFADTDMAYPQTSLEEMIARRPEVIIEAMPGEVFDDARRREVISQWQTIRGVPAVTHQQIHILTDDYTLVPSLRVGLLAERLAGIFKEVPPRS
jgi:ABC-type Fe3+-hydroxamate transport system substrate-binding protein